MQALHFVFRRELERSFFSRSQNQNYEHNNRKYSRHNPNQNSVHCSPLVNPTLAGFCYGEAEALGIAERPALIAPAPRSHS